MGNICPDPSLPWRNGGLDIAVLAGWACVLLFAADVWFVYKETPWFFDRAVMNAQAYDQAVDSFGVRHSGSGAGYVAHGLPTDPGLHQPPASFAHPPQPQSGYQTVP